MDTYNKPRIGERAPEFTVRSTGGSVCFPKDFGDRWVILYTYIGDFLPCSASDIMALNKIASKFQSYNTDVVAISPDSVPTHIAWIFSLRNMNGGRDIDIDLLSNRSLDVFDAYGISNTGDNINKNEKGLFIVDESGVLQAAHYLPQSTGINVTELERELLALQTARYQYGLTPSGWTPGEDIMDFPPQTIGTAGSNISEKTANGARCVDWYICYRQDTGQRKQSLTTRPRTDQEKQ